MFGTPSKGGQPSPDPKPSTSKQAAVENEMDMSLPTVDPTKLIYDKGHIMEWLSFSVAEVQSVLTTSDKNISVYSERMVDANMPTLIEEDFRSSRTTQRIVKGVGDLIDMTIKQLLEQKNSMFNALNIYYPALENVKPATVTLMTRDVQTDLTMIGDHNVKTTGVQTTELTKHDASCGTEGQIDHARSFQDQSTSMEGYEYSLTTVGTPNVLQDAAGVLESMEVSEEDGVPEAGTEPVNEEGIAAVATTSCVQDVEQPVIKPVLEPSKIAEEEASKEAVDVPTDLPSSPNLSDDDSLRQGENYEMIIPLACEVALDVIPENLLKYIRIHGSIRIQNSANPEVNHEDRELEDALRSLKNFDADVSRRQEKQRNRSGIRKQKSAEQLRNGCSQDIDVRDVDSGPADQNSPIFDSGHMDVDGAGAVHEEESKLDRGAVEINSEEFRLDDGFKLSDESAAMNSLFGNQMHPDAKSDATESRKDNATDPLLANNDTSPDADANIDTDHSQTDQSSIDIEKEEVRKRNRAYVPGDCVVAKGRARIIDIESDEGDDDIVVIDLTEDDRNSRAAQPRIRRAKRLRSTSDESDSNPSKRLCEDVDPSSPDVLLEWDSTFQEVPLTDASETEPDGQPMVDLTTSNQVDIEVEHVKTKLIKPQIKKEPGLRKNIRPILQEDALSLDTRKAEEEEKARQQRVERHVEQISTVAPSGVLVLDQYGGEQLKVHDMLYKNLKPHQKDGIRFMWNGCFETVETYLKSKHEGAGCILAHCMGLGKTLTAITFMQTILTFPPLGITRVLVLCPSGIVENWDTELKKWLGPINRPRVQFYNFQKQNKIHRTQAVQRWAAHGGIGVMSYTSFRLCFGKGKQAGNSREFLLEGAEQHLLEAALLICDEGHALKNKNTQIFKAVHRIKTKRRIILTGTPMQNNLEEYYWMVSFVRSQLLGTLDEFNNQFGNPILNGQMLDSTEQDVIVMRRRSSILFEKLKGTCHREGVDVLKCLIPPKQEFTIYIKLSDIQLKLYNTCLQSEDFHRVMTVYSLLSKIICHPKALLMGKTEPTVSHDHELLKTITQILEFCSTQDPQSEQKKPSTSSGETETQEPPPHILQQGDANIPASTSEELQSNSVIPLQWHPNAAEMRSEIHQPEVNVPNEGNINVTTEMSEEPQSTTISPWWSECMNDIDVELLDHSYKMVILLQLIKNCIKKKEKVLVFSQYVYSLELIQNFLAKVMPEVLGGPEKWVKGKDWFRMDGNTEKRERERSNATFNGTRRAKVYLVTSKTGGHGINLVGASRLILFDSSFNPSSDLQCIYRIYRLGQKKPTCIYRLIGGLGTAECTAFLRQKVKLGISQRVVDDHGTHRCVTKDAYTNKITGTLKQPQSVEAALVPNYDDEILNQLINSHADLLHRIENGDMEHVEDKLTEDEIANAVREFEQEIKDQQAAAAAKETANTPRKGGKKNKKQGTNLPQPPPTPEKDCVQNSSTQG